LSEYKQTKKSNVIVDKRFGENDPEMSIEEKMFLRFQKERVKRTRNSAQFNLDENNENLLTHKGKVIDGTNAGEVDWNSSDDEDGKLSKEMVNAFHFGGGLIHKPSRDESLNVHEKQKSSAERLDALQEIVMKSKLHKLQRKEAKEEQEYEREKIDKQFSELISSQLVNFKENRTKGYKDDENDNLDDYDKSMREMLFESKVQPSERSKTLEEIAIETKEKLEDLERQRIKRMHGLVGGEDTSNRKRQRMIRNDDELDNGNYNDKPLDDGNYNDDHLDTETSSMNESFDEERVEDNDDVDIDEWESIPESLPEIKKNNVDTVSDLMPHQIPCPRDMKEFDSLIKSYASRNSYHAMELINRIIVWNNIHLPGQQGLDNRKMMHNFLDVLIKYFVRLGDNLCFTDNAEEILMLLDNLSQNIFRICQDLQQSCVSFWSRTLKLFHVHSQNILRDYSLNQRSTSWFSLGKLLFFQLVGKIFSVTDLKNNIVTAASLILCRCLSQSSVSSVSDLASGLLCCGILLEYSKGTFKFVPEVTSFLNSALYMYLPACDEPKLTRSLQNTFKFNIGALRRSNIFRTNSHCVVSNAFDWKVFSTNDINKDRFALSCLWNTYNIIHQLFDNVAVDAEISFPEQFGLISHTLKLLKPHNQPCLPESLQMKHLEILELIQKQLNVVVGINRMPLLWRSGDDKNIITSKSPEYDISYTFKKDVGLDKDQSKLKQLNRQLKREKKAAMRELRRDADFIDQERYREKISLHEEKRAERVKNYAWLESQQATINQQVRKGKSLLKGGGSAIGKKTLVAKR
jgi:nucleolar protein 14